MASIFLNSNDLRQPIQMKLFKKQKVFVNVFLRFWNVDQILNILKKKNDPHNLCMFEERDCERHG